MKRGMSSLAAPQSAITQTTVGPNLLQSVWRNVNKSGSLPLSLPVPLCPSLFHYLYLQSFVRRGEDYALRRTFGTPSITRARERAHRRPNWPKFAEGNTFATDRELCLMRYVRRPTKGGVLGAGWKDSIWCKVLLSLALSLDISPRDHSLPFSPRRLLGGRRPPKRAPRPPSPKAQARH